jgi:hypothetical protein
MSKDTPSSTTQTTTSPIANAQLPFLSNTFGQAAALSQSDPMQFYPGQELADIAPQTYQALQLQANRALSGSPVTNAAQSFATNLENGNLLSAGNPYFGNMVQQIANSVTPAVAGSFEGNGRYGSGAFANALSSAITNTAGNLAYQNYGDTLGRMVSGAFVAPSLANQDYTDISQLGSVGDMLRNLQQGYINEDISRFYGNQQAPWQTLGQLSGLLGNPIGGNSSTTIPFFTNPVGQAIGAGAGLLSLYQGARTVGLLGGAGAAGAGAAGAAAAGAADSGALNSVLAGLAAA